MMSVLVAVIHVPQVLQLRGLLTEMERTRERQSRPQQV